MSRESAETQQFDPSSYPSSIGIGTLVKDRYRIDGELGRGGMGVVFKAHDQELQRDVAVKVLPSMAAGDKARERLVREARSAAGLNHANIISVYDVGHHEQTPFFVMELVSGPTFGERRPEEIENLVEFAKQICSALEHAHHQGIIHRDLKPENLLFSGDSTLKLADLGLAFPTKASRITQVGQIVGTAAYMAPEQALGQEVDARSDLYSLGVILYEMAAGQLPFRGRDPLAVVSQHIHAPVVPPRAIRSRIPTGLESIILKLLAKDPTKRFENAAQVLDSLDRAMDDVPVSKSSEGIAAVALLNALSRGRLVGRDEELAEAKELWRRAQQGAGHAVLLSGEPGAGKTRLGKELLVQAAIDGAPVLSGACFEFEATTPYLPFVDAFRSWVYDQKNDAALKAILGDSASQLAKFAPEIESRLGPFPSRPQLPPQEERLLFFDAVVSVFKSLAAKRGLVFYIDDLHWADSGTLWLLGRLLRQLKEDAVLFVCSYRETELDRAHPLGKALVDWNRERLSTRIFLRRFNRDDTQEQLEVLLGEDVSDDFADAVHRETEGNPFFVEEVLKALIEQGTFKRTSEGWEKPETLELTIPQSVMEAIGSRLDRISRECNEVLRSAAVVGKTFTFEELLAAGGGEDEDAMLDALDEGVAAQVLNAERDESFAFTHDKIREVLYKELNPIRRRRLHKRTAEGLQSLKGPAAPSVETLAHHFIEAADYRNGLQYAQRAGQEAENVHAYDEAAAAYSKALDCAEALENTEDQARTLEALGQAYAFSGDSPKSGMFFDKAAAMAEDQQERVRLQCLAAARYVTTGNERGFELVAGALEVLDPTENPFDTAHALCILARFHHLNLRHQEAVAVLQKAEPLVDLGDSPTQAQLNVASTLYAYFSGAYQHLGLFYEGDKYAKKSVELGKKYNDTISESLGLEFLGENCLNKGDWEQAIAYGVEEQGLAKKVNSRDRYGWASFVISVAQWCLGRFEEAADLLKEAIVLAQSIGERRLEILLVTFHAACQLDLGKPEEALQTAQRALGLTEGLKASYMENECFRTLGLVHHRRGEHKEAVEWCERVLELTKDTDAKVSYLWSGPVYIQSLLAMNQTEKAREFLDQYTETVANCQSPHFAREAERLNKLFT